MLTAITVEDPHHIYSANIGVGDSANKLDARTGLTRSKNPPGMTRGRAHYSYKDSPVFFVLDQEGEQVGWIHYAALCMTKRE